MLLVCCSLSATAMEVTPPHRIGAVTRPYWETSVNGDILSLCIADLDGNAPRGAVRQSEIIVGQRKSDGTGELSVLRADGSISATVPITRPVSAVAVIGDARGSERNLVIALEGGTLFGVSTAVLSPTVPFTRTWTWSPPELVGILTLVVADVAGDGTSDVLLVAGGRAYAVTSDGKQVWKSEADDITALAAADGRILLGTKEGRIYEGTCEKPGSPGSWSCVERPWPAPACGASRVLSLDIGNLEGDASPELAIACKKELDVRDAHGNRLWTYTPTLPLLQASIMPPRGASDVLLLRDQRGPFIVRRDATAGSETIDEAHFRGLLETTSAVPADVNGDSQHEIVVGAGDSVRLFGYDADGLQPGVRWAFRGSTRSPLTSIAFGDVDGDLVPEAVMGSEKDGVVYYGAEGEDLVPVLVDAGLLKALRVVNLPEDYPSDEIIAGYGDGKIHARSQSQGESMDNRP